MTGSAVPAAIDALVSICSDVLGEGFVSDGPWASDRYQPGIVLVGVSDIDAPGPDESVSSGQSWAWLGHQMMDETFAIHCTAVGWDDGEGVMKIARDRAFEVVGVLTAAIRSDPTLRGSVLMVSGVTSMRLRQNQMERGAVAYLPFDVECRARL